MKTWKEAICDSAFSGTLANAATLAAAAFFGKAQTNNSVAPVNAVSHVIWGESARRANEFSVRHTLAGAAINHGACMFWAAIYEKWVAEERGLRDAFTGGAAVSALAYVTDYHLVPKRLTPGYELRLSGSALFGIYTALALSLGLSRALRRSLPSHDRLPAVQDRALR